MADISISAVADRSQFFAAFLESGWPPLLTPPLPAATLGVSDDYPLFDPHRVVPFDQIAARGTAFLFGAENRVAEVMARRSETFRGFVNLLTLAADLLTDRFVQRANGSMRGPLDMRSFNITDMADAVDGGDVVTVEQLTQALFDYEDLRDIANNAVVWRDGRNAMAGNLRINDTAGTNRLVNLAAAAQDNDAARRAELLDRTVTIQTDFLPRDGSGAMTADLNLTSSAVDHLIVNVPDMLPAETGKAQYLANKLYTDTRRNSGAQSTVPTGAIVAWVAAPSTPIPTGWLLADGQVYNRSAFPSLYDVLAINAAFNVSPTQFRTPDMRGRAPSGHDSMGGSRANRLTIGGSWMILNGETYGLENEVLTETQIASHNHGRTDSYFAYAAAGTLTGRLGAADSVLTQLFTSSLTDAEGTSAPHNNLMPSYTMYWLVKT